MSPLALCAACESLPGITLYPSPSLGTCARCGEELPAPVPDAPVGEPLPLPPATALYAAERKALEALVAWMEQRYGEASTLRGYEAAERKLALVGGELVDAMARAAEEPAS